MNEEELEQEELLYNQFYERTKGFGRIHFIKELMRLEREVKQLKEQKELEFNDFIKFRKEQEDKHLEKTNKLIKENFHLKKNNYNK